MSKLEKKKNTFELQLAQLERQIKTLQKTLASWRKAGIPDKTLVVLLSHYTKVPQGTIRRVIDGFDNLHETYFTEDET
jgi:hypothetical protein